MSRVLERLRGWIESLPPTVRPAAFGAYIILAMMLMRGAMVIVPLAIVYVLATSPTPLMILGRGAACRRCGSRLRRRVGDLSKSMVTGTSWGQRDHLGERPGSSWRRNTLAASI